MNNRFSNREFEKLMKEAIKKAIEVAEKECSKNEDIYDYTLVNMKSIQTLVPVFKDTNHNIFNFEEYKKIEEFFGKFYAVRIIEFLMRNVKPHKEQGIVEAVKRNYDTTGKEVVSINFLMLREELMRIFAIKKDGVKGHEFLAKLFNRVDFYEREDGSIAKTYKIQKHKNENGYTYPYIIRKEFLDELKKLSVNDFIYYKVNTRYNSRKIFSMTYSEFTEWVKQFPILERFYLNGKTFEEYGEKLGLKINPTYIFNLVDELNIDRKLKKFYKLLISEIIKRDRDFYRLKRSSNGRIITAMSLLPKKIRHAMLYKNFEEFDIKSSGQTFLEGFSKVKELEKKYFKDGEVFSYNALSDYLQNKDLYRKQIDLILGDDIGKKVLNYLVGLIDSRKQVKDNLHILRKILFSEVKDKNLINDFIKRIYLSKEEYRKEYNEEKPKIFRFLKEYIYQLRKIHKYIIKHPVLTGYGNVIDNLTSFANLLEANIMAEAIYKSLENTRFIWIYDAIYFPKNRTLQEEKEIEKFFNELKKTQTVIKGLFFNVKIEMKKEEISSDLIKKFELEEEWIA